jgi:predicted MFS family arabinose efflux permease
MSKENDKDVVTSYRWVVLIVFIIIALMSQLLWLTFAPISSEIARLYEVSAFDISLLSMVWPLVFVITAIPVGIFIDKKGFKISVGIGSLCLAVFSIIRIFSTTYGYDFTLLLIAQTGAAISQPFIFGSITKLSNSWFPEKEQGLATGLGTIGLFLGMMLALALTPTIYLSFGLTNLLIIYAYVSCAAAFFFIVFAKEGTRISISDTSAAFSLHDLWTLSRQRSFLILEFGFFVVVGGFTALMTWLEQMLHALHGIGINEAGLLGGIMIIGGIVGSIIIPAVSDKIKKVKMFVVLDLAIGVITLYLIGIIGNFELLALTFFVAGFFLMSALPLVLELSLQFSGKGMEGQASSLLWFFSQVGSVFLILLIEPLNSVGNSYYYSILLIVALWTISLIFFISFKERRYTI